jgi:hypothetical protein
MKDFLNREVVVGDKVIYIPKRITHEQIKLRYGMVTKLTKDGNQCYCTSLNVDDIKPVMRDSTQIYKIE